MNNRIIIICIIFLTACNGEEAQNNFAKASPNVVFIFVDDLGWSDLGYMGSAVHETPNIDRLSSEGMIFTDFYAGGPVCSPTRASLLTGRSPVRTGITTYLLNPERDSDYINNYLDTSEFTIAEGLKENGYKTGYFGKWHLGYSKEHWASNQGFDIAKGGMDLPWAWKAAHPDRVAPMMDRSKGHKRFFSPHHLTFMEDGPEGEYLTDRLTNETIDFISENRDNPFFVLLSYHTVHTPLQVKDEILNKYTRKIDSLGLLEIDSMRNGSRAYQNLPEYAGMVHHLDENVGRLLTAIDDLGLEENTLVVFTSDNGGKAGVTSNAPLRGAKHNLNEGGIRIPTIIKWPGKIEAGSRNSEVLSTNDFFPTIMEVTNSRLYPDKHLDGKSFKSNLFGDKADNSRALFFHYPHGRFEGAMRKGDYKLHYFYKKDSIRLYNLSEDIGENVDLSDSSSALADSLKSELLTWLTDVNANFPKELKHVIE